MIKKTKWAIDLERKYSSGVSNFFLITGNINDYPVPDYLFIEYLSEYLITMGFDNVSTFSPVDTDGNVDSLYHRSSELCEKLTNVNTKSAFIVTFPELLYPNVGDSEIHNTSLSKSLSLLLETIGKKEFYKSNNALILVTESKHSIYKRFLNSSTRIHSIEVNYPNEDERYDFINFLNDTSKTNIEMDINIKAFANLTAGLTLIGIEDIYLQAEDTGVLKREFIQERKKELIKREYGDVIEMMDADGYDFNSYAGQYHLKSYHREVIIEPILNGFLDIVPKGVLYTGPPGTGKTHFARCLAGEAGINFVEFKISKILSKWVGESERNFEKALTCFKSIAPVGVFVDELDQAFQRGGEESHSVGKNIFSMFLQVLSDPKHRGKIIWIGACNYPNIIDEALKRTGRFDKKMPFLPPNEEERVEVFKIHLNKVKLRSNINDKEFYALSAKTEGYTQAEIEGIVIKSWEVALRKKKDLITFDDVSYAIDCVVVNENKKIKEMIDLAIKECNDLEFMPEQYK